MFLHYLNEYLISKTDTSNLVVGEDWNVTLQVASGGVSWIVSSCRNKLISMMEELEIIVIFRKQNAQKLSFSYQSNGLKVCSRIDFFFWLLSPSPTALLT